MQSKALLDLQSRFTQQEHQLQAVTESAATVSSTQQEEVESYLPAERVKQELDMLHNVRSSMGMAVQGTMLGQQQPLSCATAGLHV